jgi:hypothetical protein
MAPLSSGQWWIQSLLAGSRAGMTRGPMVMFGLADWWDSMVGNSTKGQALATDKSA